MIHQPFPRIESYRFLRHIELILTRPSLPVLNLRRERLGLVDAPGNSLNIFNMSMTPTILQNPAAILVPYITITRVVRRLLVRLVGTGAQSHGCALDDAARRLVGPCDGVTVML
jgi:hypothetical protein